MALTDLVYLALLALLSLWGAHRLVLLRRFRWHSQAEAAATEELWLPLVTVQLPLYNERTVAALLLRAVGALDWPLDRLEIQVLDDSDDETRDIVDREVQALRKRGVDVEVLRRSDRRGFKAGALAAGLELARGELLCVFDADFRPAPDFLRRLVPRFEVKRVGIVQARWSHLNRDENLFTRAQSTLLDGHFVIEHTARFTSDLFFNFNGTAGIWRRAAIESAGGWQHDTLTEDLDLSYRSQLSGWRFHYASEVEAPAEIPPDIAAFQSQQGRWARGSVQVLRKLGGPIVASREPSRVKLEALAHLTGNIAYPGVVAIALLLPVVAGSRTHGAHWLHLVAFVLCTCSVFLFYERSQRALGRPFAKRVIDTVAAVVLGIGMSLSQTRAVLLGMLPRVGTFVRTPKRGDGGQPGYRELLGSIPGLELLFAVWIGWGAISAMRLGNWGSLPFLALFAAGFVWVGALSLRSRFA